MFEAGDKLIVIVFVMVVKYHNKIQYLFNYLVLHQVCALQVPLDVYSQENRILSEGTANKQSINNVELDGLQAETISTRKTVESVEIESSDGGQQHMETVEEEDKEDELEITTEMQSTQGKQQREAEAERRWRLADAALLRQRDAAAVAQSRAALERTQLMSERLRLERALRREEAAAAAAARAHRHERRQLHDQILGLQLSNRHLARRLDAAVSSSASPSPCPSRADAPAAGPLALVDHALGVCPLGASSSIASGLDGESIVSGSPPGSPWLLPVPSQTSLPAFSRQHSQLSGYASGECGPTSPLAGSGVCSWNVTRPPGEPTHGAGSPDLGIESDAGRFSSLEPLSSHCGSCDREGTRGLCGFQGTDGESEYARLQKENSNLKRNLSRTKKLLEATVTQLSSSNQLKRQMELAICKQLNKTQNVLKQAKGECEVSVEPVK